MATVLAVCAVCAGYIGQANVYAIEVESLQDNALVDCPRHGRRSLALPLLVLPSRV